MTLDEHGGGIQITVKTDGQPSFYRHMSDSTKVLTAYSIYHEAYNLRQAILIFDEPSTGMHPTAQEAVLGFLKSLGHQGHQVILSTHSEYLIDLDLLGSIRIMAKGASGGLAVNDSYYRSARGGGDDLALQPVLDAIGLRFGGQINIRDRVVITEGITDMLYLRAFRKVLGYEDNLDIAPARSAPQILRLIPFFISQGISLKIVMDTGPITRDIKRDFEVSDEYIWEVPIPEDFTDRMTGSGIEDLFTKNDFRKLIGSVDVTVEEDQFAQVSNGYYIKDRRALKKSLAHHLYEHADDIDIEFDQETKDNFASVLDFCVNDEWFTI